MEKKLTYEELESKIKLLNLEISELTEKQNTNIYNENLLSTVFNGIPDPVYMIDRDYKIIFANNAFIDFQQTSHKEVLNNSCYNVFKNRDRKCVDCYIEKVFKSGKPSIVENNITIKGEKKFIESVVYPVFNGKNKVNNVLEIAREVTKLKNAENALRKSEIRHRTFLQNLDGISYQTELYNFNPIIIYGKIEEITGYKPESFLNKTVSWEQIVHPDDRHLLDDKSYKKKHVGTNREKIYRIIRKDGTIRWLNDISTHIESPDDKQNITNGIIYDITEKKLAEEAILENEKKYRLIYENTAIGIVSSSVKNLKIVNVNEKFTKIFGYTKDELYKMTFAELTHPDELQDDRIKIKSLLEGKINTFSKEKRYFHKNGDLLWGHITVSLIRDENDKPHYLIATLEDITYRKKADDILRKSEIRLRELVATKDKFFSIIAHDLKNPFNTMLGFTELLLNNYDNYSKNKNLEIVTILNDVAHNSYRLLENLLDWSKTQTGLKSYNPRKTNLNEIINNNLVFLEKSAKNKNIDILLDVETKINVLSDQDMLSTIIRNLVSNAIKFTLPGEKIYITASKGRNNKNKSIIKVSVIDNGIGIRPEDFDKLFRIDVNFSTKGTQNENGTGLGLILCKEFVLKHGGEIWAENNQISKNKYKFSSGCNFSFTLPEWND